MSKSIRRTVTITVTITESWTIVWHTEQTNDDEMGTDNLEEAMVLPSAAEIAQQLRKILGLSEEEANDSQNPIRIEDD